MSLTLLIAAVLFATHTGNGGRPVKAGPEELAAVSVAFDASR